MKILLTGGSGMLGRRLLPALVADGHEVNALVRSEKSAEDVTAAGATPIRGDLADIEAQRAGARGVEAVVHCAGRMESGGLFSAYLEDNVKGTSRLLTVAKDAGVGRFVHIGAAMCLLGTGRPIGGADESWPLGEPRYSAYVRTKTLADRVVRAAGDDHFSTIVLRPAWIWGTTDDPQASAVVGAARARELRLIDSGRHRIVTSHIDNVIAAVRLTFNSGTSGSGYYVVDDGDIAVRDFLAGLLRAHGEELPDGGIPKPIAWATATVLERAWALLRKPGLPPITRLMVALNGGPFLISDQRARAELGYRPVITRDEGLDRLAQETNVRAPG
jgi:nucleoside-diphosphate-sugar epimerase